MTNCLTLLLAAIAILNFVCVEALYFHIKETERKCFIEEVPDDTLVVGKYKVLILDREKNEYVQTGPGMGMHVEVKDPEQKTILSKVSLLKMKILDHLLLIPEFWIT